MDTDPGSDEVVVFMVQPFVVCVFVTSFPAASVAACSSGYICFFLWLLVSGASRRAVYVALVDHRFLLPRHV